MRLLVDTHIILWTAYEPDRLTLDARRLLLEADTAIVFSSVSIWEIALKRVKERPDFIADPVQVHEMLARSGAVELPFSARHALAADALPRHHTDPFDRALIAQALVEELPLLTSDKAMHRYAELITLA